MEEVPEAKEMSSESRGQVMQPWAEACRQLLEAGKGKKMDFLLEPAERNAALPTPWFLAYKNPFWISDLLNPHMHLHCFKSLSLGNLQQQQQSETNTVLN